MRLALIDGDIYTRRYTAAVSYDLHTIASTVNNTRYEIRGKKNVKALLEENPDFTLLGVEHVIEPFDNVQASIKKSLEGILDVCQCQSMRIFLGSRGKNFRHKLYPQYKSSRTTQTKPPYYEECREWLVAAYGAEVVEGIEADDALGIVQSTTKGTIICTNDKDLDTVPGQHYNFVTLEDPYRISRKQAAFNLFSQVISGDSTDDIPGVRGVGTVGARKRLAGCKTPQALYQAALAAYDGDKDTMHLMANLVYIQRRENDTFEDYLTRAKVKY